MTSFVDKLGIRVPIVQAPMAGTSTPELAVAVANAGALGSISIAAGSVEAGRVQIAETRAATGRAINVNVFCHARPLRDAAREARWIERLTPLFERFGAAPPAALGEIYGSFLDDDDMLDMLIETRPELVSFHFGLPSPKRIARLKAAGIRLVATATNLAEARRIEAAGLDAIIAQGYEAGGHRGQFDPAAFDPCLGTFALVRLLARESGLPVIAAGGIMDGAHRR